MEHEEKLVVQLDHDALAQPPEGANLLSGDLLERGVVGAEQRDAANPDLTHLGADDPGAQGMEVGLDLGKLRHAPALLFARPDSCLPTRDVQGLPEA